MKRLLMLIGIALGYVTIAAQAPQKFNYQAVLRDNAGNPMLSQAINLRFSILDGSQNGPVLFSEDHLGSVFTNQFGLFNVAIGDGIATVGSFQSIPWANVGTFLKVEIDLLVGNGFQLMGVEELLSVPYALNAGNAIGDDWGNQVVVTDATLVGGDGTANAPLTIQPGTDYYTLRTNGSGQVSWASWGGQVVKSNRKRNRKNSGKIDQYGISASKTIS